MSKTDASAEKTVSKSAYRQPITPQGLKAIEAGTLTWLDDEMYNNLNTGVLEQYLEEKNLEESFEVSHWNTSKVLIGIGIGAGGGQLGITMAYHKANAAWVSAFSYLTVLVATFYGFSLFGETLSLADWLGGALVVGSGIALVFVFPPDQKSESGNAS